MPRYKVHARDLVCYTAYAEARDDEEARDKFLKGDVKPEWEREHSRDLYDIESIEEDQDE